MLNELIRNEESLQLTDRQGEIEPYANEQEDFDSGDARARARGANLAAMEVNEA